MKTMCLNHLFFAVGIIALPAWVMAQSGTSVILPENSVTRVSDHVYAIMGFPNVAIVVGERATLVVDTGMGARNGQIITREVEKLSRNQMLYLTTTHYHPEHAAGEPGFPPRTILIRNAVQQQEMETNGQQMIDFFKSRSAQNKELLDGIVLRKPDIIFDNQMKLDLGGGVNARLLWFGAGHTKGDQFVFVEPDSALISGDIVENKMVPGMPNDSSTVKGWLALLDKVEALKPRYVVPDHGSLGDGSLIQQERAFITDLQTQAMQLKSKGVSSEEAGKTVTGTLKTKYPDWPNLNGVPNVVRRVYAESN